MVESWLDAANRPAVSPLAGDGRLASRRDTSSQRHHMENERRPDVEQRLSQTSLYRPELDLAVWTSSGEVAGYGLFWFDPVTATGIVEPMRTEDAHQGRGIARHILSAGLDRLAEAGAERISICFEPSNPASGPLYRSVGFEPRRQTEMFAGPTQV